MPPTRNRIAGAKRGEGVQNVYVKGVVCVEGTGDDCGGKERGGRGVSGRRMHLMSLPVQVTRTANSCLPRIISLWLYGFAQPLGRLLWGMDIFVYIVYGEGRGKWVPEGGDDDFGSG
jgi:hypothetical protein